MPTSLQIRTQVYRVQRPISWKKMCLMRRMMAREEESVQKVPSKEALDQLGIYQSHPLQVVLHIYDDEVSQSKPAKLVMLKFEYLLKFNVICVGIEGYHDGPESNILCNLFPHQSAKLIVGDAVAFDEKRSSCPYKWAQHLTGIDFLPEVSPLVTGCDIQSSAKVRSSIVTSALSLYPQQKRVLTVVERIHSREKAQLALAEQLDSLMKLEWPTLAYEKVPWALHTSACNLLSWSPVAPSLSVASSSSIVAMEQVVEPMNLDMDERSGRSREEIENVREDGELHSMVQVPTLINHANTPPPKVSDLEHSKHMALISKSITPSLSKSKSQNFRKHDETTELVLDSESKPDEHTQNEQENENHEIAGQPWEDYGVREFVLVLNRRMDNDERTVKLEVKIKIGMEYSLRPPHFTLSLYTILAGEKSCEWVCFDWYNELRSMEAEEEAISLIILLQIGDSCN